MIVSMHIFVMLLAFGPEHIHYHWYYWLQFVFTFMTEKLLQFLFYSVNIETILC